MYLFRIFHSFLPLRNPIGFGASDLVVLALAFLLIALIVAKALIAPYAPKIAARPFVCMALLFSLPVLLRLVLLPQSPVPIPTGADDFSYILLGDTLSHFRLANPAHPLHQFFEAVFVLQQSAYASIYPLGQGMALALGQLVLHSYWAGVLISSGVLCALCYWMLRAWVLPIWALLGGLFAIAEFGPLNPWVNSYWGGTVSAIAGCLVFGSLPRLSASPRLRHGALLGIGVALQILTRPFEATFLAFASAVYLVIAFRKKPVDIAKPALAATGPIAAALLLMLLQNLAVTHSWNTMPYMLSRYQYGVPSTLTIQPNATPHRPLTAEQDLDYKAQASIHGPDTDTVSSYLQRLGYRFRYLRFFLLPPLYFVMLVLVPRLRQPRYLWAAGTILMFALGTNFYPYFFPQYTAALTCLFILFSVRGLELLAGRARQDVLMICGASFLFWFAVSLSSDNDLLAINDFQSWNYINRGDPQGRAAIAGQLANSAGRQLVFVRYSPTHRFEEWIHNDADIDSAQTVWANDLGPQENAKLLSYYPNRNAWLLEPDAHPLALAPYPKGAGTFLPVN